MTGDDTTPSRPTRPTDPSELARLKDLFFAVSDLPDDAARRAWLQAQGVSEGLQARVMALMAEDADSTRQGPPDVTAARRAVTEALADALAPEGSATLHQAAARAMVGQRLGPWRLLSPLGAGGMGHVFLAERADGLYQREVAIKLLRGRAHPTALALLARERQILATLAHPHIARLLDGGTTPDGQPYLVMERVHGQRIDHWCETRQAPLALRLALFDQVCDAVGEAHRRLVVHCDLKPANVLVTDEAQAMLLDFGVARLQQDGNGGPGPADDDDTPDIIGLTLNYASPEQRAGEAPTPASDIYSLGRLLQTLLKGLPPTQALRGLRQRELQALLDRAMAEQPAQRYRDVGELQADLSRWHRHEPLQAMPARWTYRGGKLLRRQWPWALAGGTALLLVAGFTWQLAQQRDRALQAEAMARHEAAAAQQAADFVVGLFEGADPSQSGQPDIPARVLVDRGRDRVQAELADRPALSARLQGVLGHVYVNMGRPGEALPLLEAALAAEQQLPREGIRRDEAKLHTRIAVVLGNGNEPARAEASARRALVLLQGATEPADLMGLADTSDVLGFVLTRLSRQDEAATHLERALALRRQHLGAEHVLVARTLHHLGMMHTSRGALAEGERLYRESLAMKQRLLRPMHPSVMNTMQALAHNLNRQDRRDEALPLLEEVLRQREALLGRDSSDVQSSLNELGNALQDAGRIDEAIARYRQAVAVGERVYGPDHLGVSNALNNLGTALEDAERPEAEAVLRRSLALRQARQPAGDLAIARAEHNLARWLLREGQPEAARPLADAAAAVRRKALSRDHAEHVGSALQQVEVMLALGELPQAAAALTPWQSAVPKWRRPQQLQWHRLQGRLALARGRAAEAVAHYAQAEALAASVWPARHPARARLAVEQANAEVLAGLRADAARRLAAAGPVLAALPARGPTQQAARALRQRLGTAAASASTPRANPAS